MALANTTLAAGISAEALNLVVAAGTGAVVGQPFKIEGEYVRLITAIADDGVTLTVLGRGAYGTKAVAHATSAPVTFCGTNPSLFTGPQEASTVQPPQWQSAEVYMNADGAIPVPTRDTTVIITKGSAIAATLAVPSFGSDGVKLRIIGLTDFAHVVTVATAFLDGTSGGNTILTSAAFAGSFVELTANKGLWVLTSGATNSGPWVAT
jgi:hypothetical protein